MTDRFDEMADWIVDQGYAKAGLRARIASAFRSVAAEKDGEIKAMDECAQRWQADFDQASQQVEILREGLGRFASVLCASFDPTEQARQERDRDAAREALARAAELEGGGG